VFRVQPFVCYEPEPGLKSARNKSCLVPRPQSGQMFIALLPEHCLSSVGAQCVVPPTIARSSGAKTSLGGFGFYKHFVPAGLKTGVTPSAYLEGTCSFHKVARGSVTSPMVAALTKTWSKGGWTEAVVDAKLCGA
jgi:hypothetical protein